MLVHDNLLLDFDHAAIYRACEQMANENESASGHHWSVTPREFVELVLNVEEPVWPRGLWVWSMLLGEYGWKDFSCQNSLDDGVIEIRRPGLVSTLEQVN
jgi:hypothetical protein